MQVPVGTDQRGIVHSLATTDGAQADVSQLPDLVRGEERELYGDGAYGNEADRRTCGEVKVRYRVHRHGHG